MTSTPQKQESDVVEKDSYKAAKILYYCKDCKKAIQPARVGTKFQFRCPECKNKNVPFGTERSIIHFYDIEGGDPSEEPDEKAIKKYKDFDEFLVDFQKPDQGKNKTK